MRRITRFGILSIALVSLTLGALARQGQRPSALALSAPFAGATISDWKGKVQVSQPGQPPVAPVRGETLAPGSLLDTSGGKVLLQLADGSQILVRAHTRLMVQQPTPTDRGYFQLFLGRIRAWITKRTGGAPPFELGTPSAVIAVRGTQFEVKVNKHQETQVDVIEGLVEVISKHTGASVLVGAGSSTRVTMNSAPEVPRPIAGMRPGVGNFGEAPAASRAAQAPGSARQVARPRGGPD